MSEPSTPKKVGRFSWLIAASNNRLIVWLLTASLTLIGGWWLYQGPALRYERGKTFTTVFISNDGSRLAEEVECELTIDVGELKDIQLKPTNLKAASTIHKDGKKADITIPRLNATEKLEISFVTSISPKPKSLKIAVRAKDLIGTEKTSIDWSGWLNILKYPLFAVLVLLLLGVMQTLADSKLDSIKAARKADRRRQLPKLFRFLDGALTGKFFAGQDAENLYEKLSDRVTIGEDVYYIWSMHDNGHTLTCELATGKTASRPRKQSRNLTDKTSKPIDDSGEAANRTPSEERDEVEIQKL